MSGSQRRLGQRRPRMPRATSRWRPTGTGSSHDRSQGPRPAAASTGDWARGASQAGPAGQGRSETHSRLRREIASQPAVPAGDALRTTLPPVPCAVPGSRATACARAGPAATNDRPGRWHRRQPQRTDLSGRRPRPAGVWSKRLPRPMTSARTLVARRPTQVAASSSICCPAMCRSKRDLLDSALLSSSTRPTAALRATLTPRARPDEVARRGPAHRG